MLYAGKIRQNIINIPNNYYIQFIEKGKLFEKVGRKAMDLRRKL